MEKPTHFICNVCGREKIYLPKRRRELYRCPCGQLYELVESRYGWHQVVVGGKGSINA